MAPDRSPLSHNQTSHEENCDVAFDNLYPAIIQCFAIIFAGYLAAKTNSIKVSQSKGIGRFVSQFCLPALLFKTMCEIKFEEVNWRFMCSILISKSLVFLLVLVFTIVIKRPVNLGHAGLFAIFATQSNDFAFGYPIVQALYEKSHPGYLKYIYLVAPISLVILNPIGFMFLEINKRCGKNRKNTVGKIIWHVITGIVTNPIVFMTLIGIAGNFVFKQTVPYLIADILDVLGNAFTATALFYLGMSLVGKMSKMSGIVVLVPVLLIAAKTILLPLITWEVTSLLHAGEDLNSTQSLSMYAFLYGTFPTAPSVFLYASEYALATDIIASAMVVGTFVSAPLMFVSAKMMTLVINSELDYKTVLLETSFDVSIVGIICCVWVFIMFVLSRRWRRVPHQFTLCLITSQLLSCVGMVLYHAMDKSSAWQHYIQFIVVLTGAFASRCWTAMLALAVCLLQTHSLCFVLRNRIWLHLFGFGLPLFCVGLLFMVASSSHSKNEIDPSFHYGIIQTVVSAALLVLCISITISSLVFHQRSQRIQNQQLQNKIPNCATDEDEQRKRRHVQFASNINTAANDLGERNIHDDIDDESAYNSQTNTDDLYPGAAQNYPSASSSDFNSHLNDANNSNLNLVKARAEINSYRTSLLDTNEDHHVTASSSQSPIIDLRDNLSSSNNESLLVDNVNKNLLRNGGLVHGDCNVNIQQQKTHPCHRCRSKCSPQKQRRKKLNQAGYTDLEQSCEHCQNDPIEDIMPSRSSVTSTASFISSLSSASSNSIDIDTMDERTCLVGRCSPERRHDCSRLIKDYTDMTSDLEADDPGNITISNPRRGDSLTDQQITRHIVLLFMLILSMFIGLFLCFWRLFNPKGSRSGIYVEVEFLDGVFNYGQSFMVFAVFGLDAHLIFIPFVNRVRRLIFGMEVVRIPKQCDLDPEMRHTCEQFSEYHRENCEKAIVQNLRHRLHTYHSVFLGTDLIAWLIQSGLAMDRDEGVDYGRKLLLGRVIHHVKNERHFHDLPYFYQFLQLDEGDEEHDHLLK